MNYVVNIVANGIKYFQRIEDEDDLIILEKVCDKIKSDAKKKVDSLLSNKPNTNTNEQ